MTEVLVDILLPGLVLGYFGWAVPRVLAKIFPESVAALFVIAFVAVFVTFLIAVALFLGLGAWEGAPVSELIELHLGSILRSASLSAIIWLPLLSLSVMGLPSNWKEAEW